MPQPLFTFEDLQRLEKYQPKIINGTFTFDKDTVDQQFIDLSGHEDLRKIDFATAQPNLRYLDASRCSLQSISFTKNCESLEMLYLHSNQLKEITFEVDCPKLELLDLSDNKLTQLELPDFESLENLFLDNNQFTDLTSLSRLAIRPHFDLSIGKNEVLKSPPKEIVEQGEKAIVDWFQQVKEHDVEKAYEARILIVGEPGAGKTTLMKLLFDKNTPVPEPSQKSTLGIEVKTNRPFTHPDNTLPEINAHIWDFGGQDIQYMLHQYFLTDDSVYILISDGRKGKTRYGYWFHIINLLGKKSPILVLLNRNAQSDTVQSFEEKKYKDDFPELNIINCHELDFANLKIGWDDFTKKLALHLSRLPIMGKTIIKSWKKIRQEIDKLRNQKYITRGKFDEVCAANGLKNEDHINQLLEYLHKIGFVLNFDDTNLNNWIFLDPNWITHAIYDVLSDLHVINEKGEFEKQKLYQHWQKKDCNAFHKQQYRHEECNLLLSLMLKDKFDICYELPNKPGFFIVPIKLPDKQPDYDLGNQKKLHFRFQYRFMPAGLLSRLIVRLNDKIFDNKVWQTGAVFRDEDCLAEVFQQETEAEGLRYIGIKVSGKIAEKRRGLLKTIRKEVEYIHKTTFPYLQPDQMIVCNCPVCESSSKPNFYKLSDIESYVTKGRKTEIYCVVGGVDVPIKDLLIEIYGEPEDEKGLDVVRRERESVDLLYRILADLDIIKETQRQILNQFHLTEQRIIREAIKNYDYSQNALVETLLSNFDQRQIDENPIEQGEAEKLFRMINERLDKIEFANKNGFEKLLKRELTTGAKIKLSIPFLPFLFYESDLISFDAKIPIKSWKDILKAFKRKSEVTDAESETS